MKRDRTIIRCIIIIIMVMVLGNLAIGNIAADGPGGPHVIAGRVYNSDGTYPGDGYEGAYAAVIIEHEGVKSTYADPDGLQQDNDTYWYVVTIPEGAWDVGDKFWIWIDGSGWGDENFTSVDHNDTGVNSWEVKLAQLPVDVNSGDYNFKPMIAFLFAIILAVVGIIIGILRPLRIPFSGRPRQPSDLVDNIVIVGAAKMPEALPEEEEAAAPAAEPEEERVCQTCGGKLEFIPEYGSWYCYVCKTYPDEEDELPPPEDELPPPEDELPPPEDELPPPEGQEDTPPGPTSTPPGGA
ncbi:MAG: hypothetical protein V3U20_09610 [Thermoplasmata archaeon]